jgi:hypothetical protein
MGRKSDAVFAVQTQANMNGIGLSRIGSRLREGKIEVRSP